MGRTSELDSVWERAGFFASAVGRAHGQWMSAAPVVNSEYEVELDIPGKLIWGDQINVTESTTPAILEQDGDTLVFGTLQGCDGSAAELRLGEELILVEVDRVECQLPCTVAIKTHQRREHIVVLAVADREKTVT